MAEYHEDGMILDVEVVSDNSDKEWERYELRVTKILQKSAVYKSPEIGEMFSVDKIRKDVGCSGMWHLFGYQKV
jgi:hypothetical protein